MKRLFELKLIGKIGFVIAFCVSCAFAYAQIPGSAEIKSAQQLINQDKKKGAVEALQKAIPANPEAFNLYYYLGRAQLIAGDKAGAKASFDKGAAAALKEPLNYVGQGRMLLMDKKVAEAKALFEKAIGMGKKNTATLNAIAEAYLTDKAYQKEALEMAQRSKSIVDTNPETYLLIGDANAMVMGQGGPAASAYERAYEIDSKCATAWYKLGELFMSTSIDQAEKNYNEAVKVDPNFAEAHRELGVLYYKKKDGVNAAKHHKAYLDLTDSPQPDDRFQYAFFLFMAKDFDNANKEFEELAKKPDVSSLVLKFYAQSLLQSKNLPKCQEVYEKYLKHPDTKVDADDYNNYSKLLTQQGKDSLAMNALEMSVSIDQNQNDNLQALIKYYFEKKKYDQCERVCRISIKVRKTPNPNDYFNMGRAQHYQKKYTSADSTWAKLNELQPKFVQGFAWAARTKNSQDGDFSDQKAKIEWLAKPSYEKVIEVGQEDKEKNKKELIEAYRYLVGYYLSKQDFPKGKEMLAKILEVDPENDEVKKTIKELNNPQPQQKPKPKKG
ncbi:MAG TPA: tetratricopeptide repeat protein [Cyclobacteriaceae bacterium]|nr:tetratricopeptide repeat protein [Cyclobacteriaceae bacterium]